MMGKRVRKKPSLDQRLMNVQRDKMVWKHQQIGRATPRWIRKVAEWGARRQMSWFRWKEPGAGGLGGLFMHTGWWLVCEFLNSLVWLRSWVVAYHIEEVSFDDYGSAWVVTVYRAPRLVLMAHSFIRRWLLKKVAAAGFRITETGAEVVEDEICQDESNR